MKKTFRWLIVCSLTLLWACGKDTPVQPEPDPVPTEITIGAFSLDLPQAGGDFTLTVTAPSRPTLSVPSWIKVTDGTFSNYSISYPLTVEANSTFEERSGDISIKAGSLSKTLTVKQAGIQRPDVSKIATTLTNPKASEAAQKVYTFLREQYGVKVLSGVQSGGTANNNERLETVFQLTGKHPALSSYDFIFLQYSPTPEGWSWVVNYGDISAAREHWSKNGLVSYMWHWNVPTSKEAWDKGLEGDFDGYNFYASKTTFDIKRALVPGNWENDFLLKDIEKVAGYLKLLQQEGIPVIWRPLHEAAGNYDIYGSNGAWFWWGRGGADACKQLWKLLRDKLEGEYGLDNLIWVWTLDTTPGAESQYASWYPGNDLVDIVGVDIYEENTDAKARQFQAAASLSGGSKMTTISECGNIPDPEKCLADQECWSWFVAWDLESYSLNTHNYWKQLMAQPGVYSRETMPSLH